MEFKILKDDNNIVISNENIVIKFYQCKYEKKDEDNFLNKLDKIKVNNICKKYDYLLKKSELLCLYDNKKNDEVMNKILICYFEENYNVFKNYGEDLLKLYRNNRLPDINIMYEGLHKITRLNEILIKNNIVYADFKPLNITYDKKANDFYLVDLGLTFFLDETLCDLFKKSKNLFNTFFLVEPYLYFGPEIYILSFNNYFKKQDKKKENIEYKVIENWKKKNMLKKEKWFDALLKYFNPKDIRFLYGDTNEELDLVLNEIFSESIVQENIKKLIMHTRHRSIFNPFEKLQKNFGMFGLGITYLQCGLSYKEESELKDMIIEEGKQIIIDSMDYSKYI
jgi:hypothetical protein